METPFRKTSLSWPGGSCRKPRRRQRTAKRPGAAGIDLQPGRFLLDVAQQSGIGDPESCRMVLAILSASRAIRRALGREVGFPENSGSRFAALLTLYAFDPLPATVADLAYHAEVERSAITDVVETLERRGLVAWDRGARSRAKPIFLTEHGHQVAMLAVRRFLQVASRLTGGIGAAGRNATIEACRRIETHAAARAS